MKFKTVFFLLLCFSNPALAQDTLDPELPDRITIQDVDEKEIASYTLDQLKTNFPQHVYDTLPIGDEHRKTFRGPFLEEILKNSGIENHRAFKLTAYDDFITTIPLDDIKTHHPILAIEALKVGETCLPEECEDDPRFGPIAFDDKGPSRVVWPYNGNPLVFGMSWIYYPITLRAER